MVITDSSEKSTVDYVSTIMFLQYNNRTATIIPVAVGLE
jgi:hypothetical protein